jgi:hypothetical protein
VAVAATRKKLRLQRKRDKKVARLAHAKLWGSISPSTDMEDMTSTTSGWVETQASVGGPFELDDVELSSSALTQKEGVVADAATLVVPVAPRGDGDRGVIFFSCRIGGVWHERRRDNIVASSGASHPSWQWHGARRSSQRLRSVQLHLCIWWRSLSHGGGRLPGCALLGMSLLPCFFFPCICLAPLFSRSYYCVRAA